MSTAAGTLLRAQDGQRPIFRVKVDMVVLSFQVTDNKGHYVNGLKPGDFRIYEDGILQQISTFAEGAKAPLAVASDGSTRPLLEGGNKDALPGMERPDAFVGTNVFVLFDTSNFMYKGFVYAEDAIADFVRGLDRADSVAVYTFSRNLSRAASLTHDHGEAIAGLRKSVAGDDTALYNALLLALRDAAKVVGRKVVIVFSNGPDNASMVAPDDVRAVAEDEGIPIYVISTSEVNKDPVSSGVFKRIAQRTGGKAYWAKTWQKQVEAFENIREDLGNSYTVTYYPKSNPNEGFPQRSPSSRDDDPGKKWRIHSARPGYRPSKSAVVPLPYTALPPYMASSLSHSSTALHISPAPPHSSTAPPIYLLLYIVLLCYNPRWGRIHSAEGLQPDRPPASSPLPEARPC